MRLSSHRLQLLSALAGILTAGFLTTAILSYLVSRDTVRESILAQELPLTGDNIYSELQKDLLRPIFISSLMARDTFLRDWVIHGEHDRSALTRYLGEIKQQYGTISSFFVSEQTHRYYYPGGLLKQIDENNARDRWYFRVQKMTDPYEINVDFDFANHDTMTVFINYRVLDYQGRYIGATGVGMTLDKITQLVANYQQRFHRHIFFAAPDGNITLRSSGDELHYQNVHEIPGIQNIAAQILQAGKAPQQLQYSLNGSNTHVNSRFIPELGWFLIVEQDERTSLSALRKMVYFNIAISLAVTLLVLFGAWHAIRFYQRRLEWMASTDKLTGLINRQELDRQLLQLQDSQQHNARPLCAILLDLDHFKNINDQHGHLAGDAIIQATARVIRSQLRNNDIVARWGGEEFLIILRDCPLPDAQKLAGLVRTAIENASVEWQGQQLRITASLGLAEHKPNESMDSLFTRADEALYRAKNAGRNRVENA